MIVREYSRCRHTQWRGLVPPMAVVCFIIVAGMVGYEIGRYHRSPAEFVEAVRDRLVIEEPEWKPAEAGKAGRNR